MTGCNVLKWIDPMIGIDIERTLVPPNPIPFPSPYLHISFVGYGFFRGDSKFSGSPETLAKGPVKTCTHGAMLHGTDIGILASHLGIPLNVFLPLILLSSESKSIFSANSVKINGSSTVTAGVVIFNLNLNCNLPGALPTGVVPAITTVKAGMSFGDYCAAGANFILSGLADELLGDALDQILKIKPLAKILGKLKSRLFFKSVTENIHKETKLNKFIYEKFLTAGALDSALFGSMVTDEYSDLVKDNITDIVGDKIGTEDIVDKSSEKFGKWVDQQFSTGPENNF